jgi:hypothetical protein
MEKKLTDMEIALFMSNHIQNPCGVAVGERNYNIRSFYLRLARETIPALKDSYAIEFLKSVIIQYE